MPNATEMREILTHYAERLSAGDIDAIDLVEFDESGLIRALKAYWNPEEMRDTPAPG